MANDGNTSKELPHTFKLLTIWLILGVMVFLGFKAYERQQQQQRFSLSGQTIVLQRSADGHFHWPGEVNGVAVDFLIDTGATGTALPASVAQQAGLTAERTVTSNTAGGQAQGFLARADIALRGGVRAERLPVTVLPRLDAPLLGMDVLSRLKFSQQDGSLRIESGAP
jgi:aspartyl protease family protein